MSDRHRQLTKIAQQFSLDIIYAFGSHAKEALAFLKGEVKHISFPPRSDLDIGVKPAKGKKLDVHQKVELALLFEDLFSAPRVDLIVIPEVDPFLVLDIIRGEVLYCSDRDEEARFELFVLRKAGDLAYYKKERIRTIIKEGGR